MENSSVYFLTLFAFCSSICLAQTKSDSPLMMMRLGEERHKGPEAHDTTLQQSQEERRKEEAQDSDANPAAQVARGSAVHVTESDEAVPTSGKTTQDDIAAICDFKRGQVELITSKIDFLKTHHPDQTDLISLLESYLQKYEEVLDLRTFEQWRIDEQSVLLEEELNIEQEQKQFSQQDRLYYYAAEANWNGLKSRLCEHEIIDATLAEPVQLEKAQSYSQIRSIHLLSRDAYENARKQLEQKRACAADIDEYTQKEFEFEHAKKAYYQAIEDHYYIYTSNHKKSQNIQNLFAIGRAKKREFQACAANLCFYHGSLEKAKQLQQQRSLTGDAMAKSGSFFKQKAAILQHLATKILEQPEISCYHHQATTLDLLAQDHLSLAQAIAQENTIATEHIKKLVSFALEAKSVFEHQLSIFQYAKQPALAQNIADNYGKSFNLLEEAGQCFLSAYRHLKNQDPSFLSQNVCDRGTRLMNTAFIFQFPPIPPEQRTCYDPDWLASVKAAQQHAERVVQTAPHEETRLYHEKVASFLYEKISALNHYFETLRLKRNTAQNSFSSFFLDQILDQTASRFWESRNHFEQLSQFSLSELNSANVESLIHTASETKAQAKKLLFQTKNLLLPPSTAPTTIQNQDLHSWSD